MHYLLRIIRHSPLLSRSVPLIKSSEISAENSIGSLPVRGSVPVHYSHSQPSLSNSNGPVS